MLYLWIISGYPLVIGLHHVDTLILRYGVNEPLPVLGKHVASSAVEQPVDFTPT